MDGCTHYNKLVGMLEVVVLDREEEGVGELLFAESLLHANLNEYEMSF